MTFLTFRPFRRRKHRNDVIVTSYIKISQILKLKSKDITSKTLHSKFYASRIKNKRIRRGVKYAPRAWSVFKSPGKIGLNLKLPNTHACSSSTQESCPNRLPWVVLSEKTCNKLIFNTFAGFWPYFSPTKYYRKQ